MMKSNWKRWFFGTLLVSIVACALLLWQAPVLARLPYHGAYFMFPDSRLKVSLNGQEVRSATAYSSSRPGSSWPDLLVLDFPEKKPDTPKIMVDPARMVIGDSGSRGFQHLGPWLIRADFALYRNLYGVKGFEGEPQFEKATDYLRFRLPKEYEAFPGDVIEIRRAD